MKRILATSALLALALAVPAFGQGTAADLYKTKCQACHGADGKGKTPVAASMGVRDFTTPPVSKESDADMISITTKGKNKMPAYGEKLTAAQIQDLVKLIRAFK